jgi:hypothetical protein
MAHKGQKSTLMAAYFHTVDVDGAAVGDAAEANENLPLIAVIGQEKVRLIPEVPAVVPGAVVGEEVRKAGGNRHIHGGGEFFTPAVPLALRLGVKLEAPQTVQRHGAAGVVAARVKHGIQHQNTSYGTSV